MNNGLTSKEIKRFLEFLKKANIEQLRAIGKSLEDELVGRYQRGGIDADKLISI